MEQPNFGKVISFILVVYSCSIENEKWFACSAVVKFRDFPANYACFSKDGTVAIIAFENFLTFWQTASATLLHNLAVSKSDSIRYLCSNFKLRIVGELSLFHKNILLFKQTASCTSSPLNL